MDNLFVQSEGMDFRCAFCNRSQEQVEQLIAGPNRVYICDDCVETCNLILREQRELERQRRLASGDQEADRLPEHSD